MSVPLPLMEVWEDLQPEVEHLTGIAGLKIIRAVIEDEVIRPVGPKPACLVQKQSRTGQCDYVSISGREDQEVVVQMHSAEQFP